MPYKTGEFKGELTAAEIRKLIRGHNKLVSLKIPTGLDRNGLIKFLARNKYEVDHKNQKLINKVPSRYTQVSLERAERITKRKPKPEKKEPEKKEPEKKPEKKEPEKPKESDSEILKKNGYPTLSEYKENIKKLSDGKPLSELPLKKREEIVKYVEKTAKELGVSANIEASPKDFFDRQVGNLQRQFGFLAQKIRDGKVEKKPRKKISKELKESIQYGVNLEDNKYNLDKEACKLFMFAAKKLIQADKDDFKKVKLFTNDEMPSRLENFGKSIGMGNGTPSPLLRLYDFLTPGSYEWWENTIRQIKNDCGVKEAIFVETAYDILYRKYDQIKEILLKQNKKFDKEKLEKFIEQNKPKKIDYLFYEKK